MRKIDPFALYKTPKMKKLLNRLISVVMIFTVLYAVLEFLLLYNFDYMAYIGSSGFATVLVIVILAWVVYLILNNRFHPDLENTQPKQGRPQRRPPARPLEYQEPVPVPIELEMDVCNYCGREYPTSELEEVVYENRIYKICRKCINE